MIRLDIFKMNDFLNVVDHCGGPVVLHSQDGTVTDIRQNPAAQNNLKQQHQAEGGRSRLRLDIPEKTDYMDIVLFSLGDC
ncbi:hypothetical protein AALB39_18425 [Lachnospiraceae bacterium 54-53]